MKKSKTVVLLGGSFDPIHLGHLAIASALEAHYAPDEVWFLPTPSPRWKSTTTAFTTRVELVKLAIQDHPTWRVSLEEWKIRDKSSPTYTINTIRHLIKRNPNFTYILAIGSDQFERFAEWKEPDEIRELVTLAVIDRPGHSLPSALDKRFKPERVVMTPSLTSSASIRQGLSWDMPELVAKEVIRLGLYLEEQIKMRLTKPRFEHTIRVARLAVRYAKRHGLDENKAYVAAMVHDVSREKDLNTMKNDLQMWGIDIKPLADPMIHAFHGAEVAKREFHIDDPDIYAAIQAHTFGAMSMIPLSKVLYCADKTESGRGEYTVKLQEKVYANLDQGTITVMKDDIDYWLKQQATIDEHHPLRIHLNKLIKESQ